MKRLLIPFAFLLASPCYADITHTLQSVVSVSTLAASSTSERIGSAISVSGTNVTPKANTVAGQIGSLDLADAGIANGVPTVDYDTSFNVVNTGDSFSASETYIQAAGGDPGSVAITLDSGQALTVNLADMGAGTTATLQATSSIEID